MARRLQWLEGPGKARDPNRLRFVYNCMLDMLYETNDMCGLRRSMSKVILAVGLYFVAVAGLASAAVVPAFDFPQPANPANTATGNDAYYFTPVVNFWVTALGMYDHNQDGLTQDHPVSLYEVSGSSVIASAVVGGTDGFVRGVFRYLSISPVLLQAGTQYAIVGFTLADTGTHAWNPPGLVIAPEIGYDGYTYNYNSYLSLPAGHLRTDMTFFGPGFLFHAAPEPSSDLLVGAGLILLAIRRRKPRAPFRG